MGATIVGPSESAKALGANPKYSVEGPWAIQNETCFHPTYRQWVKLMRPALGSGQSKEEQV